MGAGAVRRGEPIGEGGGRRGRGAPAGCAEVRVARAQRPGAGPAPRPAPIPSARRRRRRGGGRQWQPGLVSRPHRPGGGQVPLERCVLPVTPAAWRRGFSTHAISSRGGGGGNSPAAAGTVPQKPKAVLTGNGGAYSLGGFLRGLVPCGDRSRSEYTYVYFSSPRW